MMSLAAGTAVAVISGRDRVLEDAGLFGLMRPFAVLVAALALAPAASGATQLGIFGNIGRFHSLTGQQSTVGHVIVGWNQTTFNQIWPTLGPVPMLGFGTGQGSSRVDHAARDRTRRRRRLPARDEPVGA